MFEASTLDVEVRTRPTIAKACFAPIYPSRGRGTRTIEQCEPPILSAERLGTS